MLKKEIRKCKLCKKHYVWKGGGIIMQPIELSNNGLCPKCRGKKRTDMILGG